MMSIRTRTNRVERMAHENRRHLLAKANTSIHVSRERDTHTAASASQDVLRRVA